MYENGILELEEYLEGIKIGYKHIQRNSDYTNDYKAKQRNKAIFDLKEKQRNLLESQLEDVTEKRNELIKKYTPKKLEDLTYIRKRTELNDRLQLSDDKELEKLLQEATPEADPMEIDLAILELKNRGNDHYKDWKLQTDNLNLKEKHKNDPLWKDLDTLERSLKIRLVNDDFLYLKDWENDQRKIMPVERALEG